MSETSSQNGPAAAQVSREVNQENLLRAILDRITSENLLTNPAGPIQDHFP